MAIPGIHICSKLSEDNERLVKVLKKFKKKNDALEEELRAINERLRFEEFIREHTLKISTAVQTDIPGYKPLTLKKPSVKQKEDLQTDQKKQVDSLLKINKSLMKKYQKELKANATHLETIAGLNLRIQDLEKQMSQYQHRIQTLEAREERPLSRRSATPKGRRKRRKSSISLTDSLDLKTELDHVRQDRDRLKKEKLKLKKELGALDDGFFEEIEDIKYALQQSARLNKQYESTLEGLCRQFGVPVPSITVTSEKKLSKRKHSR